MRNIEVERQSNELTMERWLFWFNERETKFVVSNYFYLTRSTKRHKFSTVKKYDRLLRRDNTIDIADVPLPDDVKQECLKVFINQLTVTK